MALVAGASLAGAALAVYVAVRPGSPAAPATPPLGTWSAVPSPSAIRGGGVMAAMLGDHSVLLAGGGTSSISSPGAEIFSPYTRSWQRVQNMHHPRRGGGMVTLPDGRVLVAGGIGGPAGAEILASAEVFDPLSLSWTELSPMNVPRVDHTLTAMPGGMVLAAGGISHLGMAPEESAELYDPRPGAPGWVTLPTTMMARRAGAQAVPLDEVGAHRVLIAGGEAAGGEPVATAELFDAGSLSFQATGSMARPRADFTLTSLPDGRVLAAGGEDRQGSVANAEIFEPASGSWSGGGVLGQDRRLHSASRLPDGRVLVAGGEAVRLSSHLSLRSAELFDPATGSWTRAADMGCARGGQAQVSLVDASVLVVGGDTFPPRGLPHAESCAQLFRAPGS